MTWFVSMNFSLLNQKSCKHLHSHTFYLKYYVIAKLRVFYFKVNAAEQLLNRLSTQPKIGEIVGQMTIIVNAYISLAAAKAPSSKVASVVFPKTIQLSVQDLHLIPILSKSIDVQRDGMYKFQHFRAFGLNIRFVGGINKPKLIACEDSEGKKHRELVKSGSDDLRQVRNHYGLF